MTPQSSPLCCCRAATMTTDEDVASGATDGLTGHSDDGLGPSEDQGPPSPPPPALYAPVDEDWAMYALKGLSEAPDNWERG